MIVPSVRIALGILAALALNLLGAASPALGQVDFTNGIPDGFTFGPGAVNVLVDPADPRSSQSTADFVPRVGSNFTTSSGLAVQNGGVVGRGLNALAGSFVNVNVGGVIQSAPGTVFLGTDTDFTTLGTVFINGGSIGSGFDIGSGSEVNVIDGSIGDFAQAFSGSEVNVEGGVIGNSFSALAGSEVNFSGGSIFRGFTTAGVLNQNGGSFISNARALNGSTVNVNPGGNLGLQASIPFFADAGSTVNINGGTAGPGFRPDPAAQVRINGGQIGFDSDQLLRADGMVTVTGGSLTNFSSGIGSTITLAGGSVGFVDIPSANAILTSINPVEVAVFSTLNIAGGMVAAPFFALPGSTVNLSEGSTYSGQVSLILDNDGDGIFDSGDEILFFSNQTVGGPDPVVVNVTGGSLGDAFIANANGEINISGGTVGNSFNANSVSLVNISGGVVGRGLSARDGSVVNIGGGIVGDGLDALDGSVVNISGGTIGDDFDADPSSEVNLFGTEFSLDGNLIESLMLEEALIVADRNVRLSGLLADGTPFEFDLDNVNFRGRDYFSTQATLTITLVAAAVPEPVSAALVLTASVGLLAGRRTS